MKESKTQLSTPIYLVKHSDRFDQEIQSGKKVTEMAQTCGCCHCEPSTPNLKAV